MRETGIHAESERFVQSYKCSSGIFTQQGSTVVYKEKQINLHNMESVHTRILTVNINSNPVVPSFKFASSQPKEIVGKSRNDTDSLIQKKENRKSQFVSGPAPVSSMKKIYQLKMHWWRNPTTEGR